MTDITIKKSVYVREDDISVEQFFEFVKKFDHEKLDDPKTWNWHTRFHLKKFAKYGHRRFFLSLNWPFTFFNVIWLFYRKAYWAFWLIFIPYIPAALYVISDSTYQPHFMSSAHKLTMSIILSVLMISFIALLFIMLFAGNMIYHHHVRRCIMQGKFYKKGVSVIAPVIVLFLSLIGSPIAHWALDNFAQFINSRRLTPQIHHHNLNIITDEIAGNQLN